MTVTVAGELVVPEPPFAEVKDALLSYDWQPLLGAVAVNVIETVSPGLMLHVPNVRLVCPAVGFTVAVRVPPVTVPIAANVKPAGSESVTLTPVAVSVELAAFVTVMVNVAVPPRATDEVEVVFAIVRDGGTTIVPDVIWLSRLPIESPSAATHFTWYGPPETFAAPRPVPHPRTPFDGAMCPPKSSWILRVLVLAATSYVTVTEA